MAVAPDASEEQKAAACDVIQDAWKELADKVVEEFVINGFKLEDITLLPGYRMQYMGQLNDLEISSPISGAATPADWKKITNTFGGTYSRGTSRSTRSPALAFRATA